MPFIEVFTPRREPEMKKTMMEEVRDIVSDSFRVDKEFVTVLLDEFPGENMLAPEPLMTVIVHCFAGRTVEQKRELYARLNRRMKEIDPAVSRCQVTVEESPLENWGIGNGVCAADVMGRGG